MCLAEKSHSENFSFFPFRRGGILRKVFFFPMCNSKILTIAGRRYLILNEQHFFSVEEVEMFYGISTELEKSGLNRCSTYFIFFC